MRGIILFTALIVCVAFAQPIVKIDWTQVNVQSGSLESVPTHVLPRAASFSDGRYIVVYTIRTANSDARVYGQIFNANGSVAVSEFDVDPDASDINVMSSPTVAVFPDDTFVIAYRWDSGDPVSIWARRYNTDGTAIDVAFRVDRDSGAVISPEGIELVGYADKSIAVFYHSTVAACPSAIIYDSSDTFVTQFCIYSPGGGVEQLSASAILDSTGTTAYVTSETDGTYLNIGTVFNTQGTFYSNGPVDQSLSPTNVAIALTGDRTITVLFSVVDSIYYATTTTSISLFSSGPIATADNAAVYFSPAVVGLNDTSVLIAYKSKSTAAGEEQLLYKTASLTNKGDTIELAFSSNLPAVNTMLHDFQFAPLSGSDIVVVAKDSGDSNIYYQVLTFCGNGFLELQEECDSSANCDTNCRCTNGLIGYNGVCGQPNVIPVLDCIGATPTGHNLYFSFINEDGIEHVMEHGYQNFFTPAGLADNRPTVFTTGSTLTYPASPYTVAIPTDTDVTQLTWLLGSYNLTVDLSAANLAALQCPDSPGFVMDVGTNGFSDALLFAENFANRYNLSTSRLNTNIVQTGGSIQGKRIVYAATFDVTIIVVPANVTNPEEPTPAEAVRSVVEEFKNEETRDEVKNDLVAGNVDTEIKDITPTPTGVEVRGNRYDTSNVTPPTSTNPTSSPSTPSGNVSGSNMLSPCLALISAIVIFICFN